MAASTDEPCLSLRESLASEEHERLLFELDEPYDLKPPERLSTPCLLLLTCPSLGLQVCWFLLQSSGTPYLRSLGMAPSSISVTWALGPIFGAFVQPIIGQLNDELHHSLGRKPVMIAGALTTVIPALLMAYALEVTTTLTENSPANPWQPRAFAVACLAIILLALTAYSVGVRAIVVDACPPSQQPAAAAWSMRWNVLGSTVLSSIGFVTIMQSPESDPVAAFRILVSVAAMCSAATVGLVCWFVPPNVTPPLYRSGSGVGRVCAMCRPSELVQCWRWLPPLTRRVCGVQLVAWFGWFPVLYYMSTYAYETALSEFLQTPNLKHSPEAHARHYPLYASLSMSMGTLMSTLLLALLSQIPATLHALHTRNLPRLWLLSQLVATTSLLLTIPLQTATASLILLSLIGASLAVTMWVPFALINTELANVRTGVAGVQGLQNMAISLPQVASALACAVVLAGLDLLEVRQKLIWLLRLAAVPVAWSAWLIWRLEGAVVWDSVEC